MRGVLANGSAKAESNSGCFNNGLRLQINCADNLKKIATWGFLAILTSCGGKSLQSPSLQELANSKVPSVVEADKTFETDEGDELRVVSRAVFEQLVSEGQVIKLKSTSGDANQLLVALPKTIVGKKHYFGAVITKTDDLANEQYGGLKLTDLPPLHVFPRIDKNKKGESVLLLEGCPQNCKPNFQEREAISAFPISGEDKDKIYVDFSKIGSDLNLVEIFDPYGQYLHLRGVSAKTVEVSYSASTLEFDVEGIMEEMPATLEIAGFFGVPNLRQVQTKSKAKQVKFTTRWYLKKSFKDVNFKPQVPTDGVGYFLTERFETPHVIKHPYLAKNGKTQNVHYFIKNVPEEFKASFQQAFEDWNDLFQDKLGVRLLTYEFVNANDPLAETLTPGDVRVHILEWDLLNRAPYGGLGPSIADQETGSILSSNVLIQGPAVVEIYSKWFQVNREAQALEDSGLFDRAAEVLREGRNEAFEELTSSQKGPRFQLALNGKLLFRVNAQDPRLQDNVATKLDFETIPEGVSYEEYMFGYFREMVAHELGHNMGLRHNFRGNLFASSGLEVGRQSASIMEYLGRTYRHKDRISEYDHMAINYGYKFVDPARRDMFCTDENVGDIARHRGSAECSRDDAENDPYTYFVRRFARVRDLYIGAGTTEAPLWTKDDIKPHFAKYSDGILAYGESAQRSMETWIRFFALPGRPQKDVAAVKQFVTSTLSNVACEAGVEETLKQTKSPEAAQVALTNLNDFRKQVQDRLKLVLGDSFSSQINCVKSAVPAPLQDDPDDPNFIAQGL